MYIIALIKTASSKNFLKDYCTTMGYGFEFVHTVADFQEALESNPDMLFIEAQFGNLDYEDILADLNYQIQKKAVKIVLINNTPDVLENLPYISHVIEEHFLAQRLPLVFSQKKDQTKKILYASDDKFMHRVIGDLLRKNTYEVIQAFDGIEALSLYQSAKPHLILTLNSRAIIPMTEYPLP